MGTRRQKSKPRRRVSLGVQEQLAAERLVKRQDAAAKRTFNRWLARFDKAVQGVKSQPVPRELVRRAARESVKRRLEAAERAQRDDIAGKWERWCLMVLEQVPTLEIDVTEAIEDGVDPDDATQFYGWQVLRAYVPSFENGDWDHWRAGDIGDAAIVSWASTGVLPFEAVDAPVGWRYVERIASAGGIAATVFATDYVDTVALRASREIRDTMPGEYEFLRQGSQWVLEKRKWKTRKQRPRRKKRSR